MGWEGWLSCNESEEFVSIVRGQKSDQTLFRFVLFGTVMLSIVIFLHFFSFAVQSRGRIRQSITMIQRLSSIRFFLEKPLLFGGWLY